MVKKKTTFIDKEVKDLNKILSGQMALKEKKEEILKAKKEAIKKQRELLNKGIESGDVKVEGFRQNKKIVQKIKLFEWSSPIRVAFNFEKKNFLIVVSLCLIFIFYLAILGNYILMFAIISFLFLIYVAGTTKPVNVTHSITARGVETMDILYEWYVLESFFFTKKKNQHILVLETNLRFPNRLILLFKKKDKDSLFLLLQDQVLYKDIKNQNFTEKLSLGEYIPLEKV